MGGGDLENRQPRLSDQILGLLTSCGSYALYTVLVCIDRLNY